MAGKTRHLKEKSGRFYARLAVPKALQAHFNKSELLQPIGSDKREALRQLPQAVALLQSKIAVARGLTEVPLCGTLPPRPAQVLSVERLAVEHYKNRLANDLRARNAFQEWASIGVDDSYASMLDEGQRGSASNDALASLVGPLISRLEGRGLTNAKPGTPEWRELAIALCAAEYEALSRIAERDESEFTGKPRHPILDTLDDPEPSAPVDLTALWSEYVTTRQMVGSMRDGGKRQFKAIESLAKYTNGKDANTITKKEVLNWRNQLLKELQPQTIAKVYLPTVRSLFKWAVENDHMVINPAEGIRQSAPKPVQIRERGYTDTEAKKQLSASLNYRPKLSAKGKPLEDLKVTLAKRWIPLLCAFSGARITELAQLRREDLSEHDGHWVMRISPDAGSVKTNQFRDVPLHQQIIQLGFASEVAPFKAGPLFHMSPSAELNHMRAKKMTDRLRDWVHTEGLVPEGVQPWHGWRHRFKTVGLELGIAERVLDCIQGHAARTAGEMYGDVTTRAKIDAISRFPSFELE